MIGVQDTSAAFALDLQDLGRLRLQAKQDQTQALKGVAQQFEAIFLDIMLKSMRNASGQDGPFDSDQSRMYTQLFDQQLSQKLSSGKGMGLAELIVKQMTRAQGISPNATTPSAASSEAALVAKPAAAPTTPQATSPATAPLSQGGGAQQGRVGAKDFVNRLWQHAAEVGKDLGVAPHLLLGQAALESAWGQREIRAEDGRNSYNLFGIKAGSNWKGDKVAVTTTEYVGGVAQKRQEVFRAYGSYAEAFRDYANLLRSNPRYQGALDRGGDAAGFAQALQRGGYATDPSYALKLARVANSVTMRQALMG